MKPIKNLSIAAAVATLLATGVVAQDNSGSSGQMMDSQGNMSGMMPMMQMMQQMGPMMKACTEMMEAMNGSMMETKPSTDKG